MTNIKREREKTQDLVFLFFRICAGKPKSDIRLPKISVEVPKNCSQLTITSFSKKQYLYNTPFRYMSQVQPIEAWDGTPWKE